MKAKFGYLRPEQGLKLFRRWSEKLGIDVTDTAASRIARMDTLAPGDFAAGEFVGGIHGAVRIGACAVMDCLVNGREAGREAAKSKAWC